jgi:hypothetical protein
MGYDADKEASSGLVDGDALSFGMGFAGKQTSQLQFFGALCRGFSQDFEQSARPGKFSRQNRQTERDNDNGRPGQNKQRYARKKHQHTHDQNGHSFCMP